MTEQAARSGIGTTDWARERLAQRDRNGRAMRIFEIWRGRQLHQLGRLADAGAILESHVQGVLALDGIAAALDEAAELLERARSAGIPIIHVQHDAGEGSPYDIRAEIGEIVDQVVPHGNEIVIVKHYPNSFVQTDLDDRLKDASAHNLLLAGFMTHMCVNSTTRGAFNLGYAPTIVATATATRALPGTPDIVSAAALQAASLAAIGDLFGIVVPDVAAIPD